MTTGRAATERENDQSDGPDQARHPSSLVLWLSGPATEREELARAVIRGLLRSGHLAVELKDDAVRRAVRPQYPHSHESDSAFQQVVWRLAGVIADQGMVVVVSASSSAAELGNERGSDRRFIEVLVDPTRTGDETQSSGVRNRIPGSSSSDAESESGPDVVASGRADDSAVSWILDQVARRVA